MPGMAAKVIITERQQEVLRSMVWSRSCPQGLAHRAEIILLAFEGFKNEVIADRLSCERPGVGIWRKRWKKAFDRLVVIECVEKPRRCERRSGKCWGICRGPGAAASSRPSRSRGSSRWPANRRTNRDDPCRTGRRGNWPTKWSNAALSRRFPSAGSGVF